MLGIYIERCGLNFTKCVILFIKGITFDSFNQGVAMMELPRQTSIVLRRDNHTHGQYYDKHHLQTDI